ncbi:hypothetical protein JCM3774_004606 [Rhodotorula dairenensis]
MRGPRWAPIRRETTALRERDENRHALSGPSKPRSPFPTCPSSRIEPRQELSPDKPSRSVARLLPHNVLSRIFECATADLSLDRHHADILSKVGLVCKRWLQATKRLRVVRISNSDSSDSHFERSRTIPPPACAALPPSRLWLDLVFHDPEQTAYLERTTREVERVLASCYQTVTHLRVDVATLPVQFLSRLSLPALVHLELYNSNPRLRRSATGADFALSLLRLQNGDPCPSASWRPHSVRVESGVSSEYVRHLSAARVFEQVVQLSARLDVGNAYLEGFHLADFGDLGRSLERLELQLLGAVNTDYHYHCYRRRLYATVRALAPPSLCLEAAAESYSALCDALHTLAVSSPSPSLSPSAPPEPARSVKVAGSGEVVALSVKGCAAANGAPAQTEPGTGQIITLRAARPPSGQNDEADGPERRRELKTAICALLCCMEAAPGPARTLRLPRWMKPEGDYLMRKIRRTTVLFVT